MINFTMPGGITGSLLGVSVLVCFLFVLFRSLRQLAVNLLPKVADFCKASNAKKRREGACFLV